ncbi:MAG: hypothetical protein CMM85_18775 [Rhodothermaceae bacterium]|nr:hypothetical protein [Rhodothermaceae bacterium]
MQQRKLRRWCRPALSGGRLVGNVQPSVVAVTMPRPPATEMPAAAHPRRAPPRNAAASGVTTSQNTAPEAIPRS